MGTKVIRPLLVTNKQDMKATVLLYQDQYSLMYALARFQEFYEHRSLAGTVFSRATLQDFDPKYYVSWNGCNFPSYVVSEFRNNYKAWKLDDHEQAALDHMTPGTYVIGVHAGVGGEALANTLRHEYAHAVYADNKQYRDHIEAIAAYARDFHETKLMLGAVERLGYPTKVWWDELQAYACSGWEKLKLGFPVPSPLQAAVDDMKKLYSFP